MIAISVVIPYYGERAALHRCLRCLAGQSLDHREFEVIVVNNRPGQELVLDEKLGSSMNVTIVKEEQPGSYAARNRGAQLARGRWLAFTDADCLPESGWLDHGLRLLDRQDPLGGHIQLTVRNPDCLVERYDAAFGLNQKSYVEKMGFAATANLLVSKKLFQEVGPFAESLRSGGDLEWCRRASRSGHPVAYCREAVVLHPARTGCWDVLRKALRIQGGVYMLEQEFGVELPAGVARSLVDVVFPRLYAARLLSMRREGQRFWWRLYLLACLVNAVVLAERWRLRLGGVPLR